MTARWHRLGTLVAVLLMLAAGPASTLASRSAGCGCSKPSGPCPCCIPAANPDTQAHGAGGHAAPAHGTKARTVVGRCHLRSGKCETSSPHPIVISSDRVTVGVIESDANDEIQRPSFLGTAKERRSDDRLATGPEPPPPRRIA